MNEIWSWCCKTEGLSAEQVQSMLDGAIKYGAEECDTIESFNHEDWVYFGVDKYKQTYFADEKYYYDIELQYHQIEHYIKTEEILPPKDSSNPSQEALGEEVDVNLNEHTHSHQQSSQSHTGASNDGGEGISVATMIVQDGSHFDTRKDILLQVQKLCQEYDVQIQIYSDEIVMNHVGYDDEFGVTNVDDVIEIVGAFETLDKFKRG